MASRYGYRLDEFLKLTQKEVEFLTLTAIRNKVEERNERFLLAGAKKSDLPEYKCKMKHIELTEEEKIKQGFEIYEKIGKDV